MAEEEKAFEYTDIQLQFLNLLKKYPIKNAETIVDYVTSQGETVLEDPETLARSLAECEITPVRRRQLLKHWFAEKGVAVPEELLEKVALPPERRRKAEQEEEIEKESKQAKYSVDEATGAIKVAGTNEKALTWGEAEKLSKTIKKEVEAKGKEQPAHYVFDAETRQVRMAREGEVGGTLEQAKELKKMAEEGKGREQPAHYAYDTETGQVRMAKEGEIGGTLEQAKELKKMAEEGKSKEQPARYVYDTETRQVRMAKEGEIGGTLEQAKELKKMAEEGKGKEQPVRYAFDTETGQVRMAKEGEMGGTLEQARELKKMAEEGRKEADEPPFIQDNEGNWSLNPKGRMTGIELMALDSIRRAQEKGEPVDPLEVLSQTAEKIKVYQGVLGGAAKELPEWMTDPVKFIETVRTISGEPKEDGSLEALKAQIGDLTKKLDDMKEERHREEIAGLQSQMRAQNERMAEILDRVEDMKKPVTGRTEMDIIHEVATEGIGLAKTELSGLRRDIKETLGSTALPAPKTAQEREERKRRWKGAVQQDKEIEELGRKLFFGEG